MELRKANAWVLSDLGFKPGHDLAPRRVDFNLVFPTTTARDQNETPVRDLGFNWELSVDAVKPGTFEATAYRELSPQLEPITHAEIALIEQITPYGGYVDGWGFFGNSVH
jgi:hypothetical protein